MACRADSFGRVEIFERDGYAVERTAIDAAAQFFLRLPGLFQGQIRRERDETMQLGVMRFDTVETGVGEFDGGKLFAPEASGGFGNGQITEFVLLHGVATLVSLCRH